MSELARVLAQALAADIRQWPDGPPAEASATSGTVSNRRRPERIVSGRLHPSPEAFDCSPVLVRVVGGAA
jgi:hypothetical protein